MELQTKVWEYCRAQGLLSPGDRVICALSGGKDSMALLWAMYLLREKLDLELSAAHFNHGLRGAESDRDEAFVRAFCARYAIPLAVGRGQVRPLGKGLEDAARRARYGFFETLDETAKIATAHTADDNAETMVMRLLRGAGLKGLGGIAPRRGRIIRPMLTITAGEVADFLRQWSLPHVHDSSNAQRDFLRNRIRQEVMPLLYRENPGFSAGCGRTAQALREDQALLDALAADAYGRLHGPQGLDCSGLLALHPALQRRVLARFLEASGVREPEAVHMGQARALAASPRPSAQGEFPGGVIIARRYGRLQKAKAEAPWTETPLKIPGVTRVGPWEILCRIPGPEEETQSAPMVFTLRRDCLEEGTPVIRPRQKGDTIRLPGGTRSLKKLLIDRKVPAMERDQVPVLAVGRRVLAVFGIGADVDMLAIAGADALQIVLRNIK